MLSIPRSSLWGFLDKMVFWFVMRGALRLTTRITCAVSDRLDFVVKRG
jgi:hypothetical protein